MLLACFLESTLRNWRLNFRFPFLFVQGPPKRGDGDGDAKLDAELNKLARDIKAGRATTASKSAKKARDR